jgi:hypothetical protein
MGIRNNYATDRNAEIEGVEIPVDTNEHNGQPIVFVLSRMGQTNKAYTKALEERTRPHQAAIQAETLDNELGARILREVFVDTCLKTWRNLPKSELTGDPKDKGDLEFTRENALKLFEEFPDFYTVVETAAKKASNFREAAKKVNAKN